jgi:hypothetical protein
MLSKVDYLIFNLIQPFEVIIIHMHIHDELIIAFFIYFILFLVHGDYSKHDLFLMNFLKYFRLLIVNYINVFKGFLLYL